ncbi:MAG: hypothetical protein HKN53_09475 [Maribacter sp.]|nr:hypothetical protein [Maribacter sp.]
MLHKLLFLCCFLLCYSCNNTDSQYTNVQDQSKITDSVSLSINYAHLNHLYKEVLLPNGKEAAIIHIYSNYPDYSYDIEPKEGYTCVDDVARAIILLSADKTQEARVVKLTEFLLYMQNENGWFNNFIRKDLSINTTYKTSVAQPDWWSWRALWALEKALPLIKNKHTDLEQRVVVAINTLVEKTKQYLSELRQMEKQVEGISIATNLPYESATDQGSILLIGLYNHYQRAADSELKKPIRQLADGILQMQIKEGEMKGLFLSWENLWHAYGNTQSYALLLVGKLLEDNRYTDAALLEINFFYPFLYKIGFPEIINLKSNNDKIEILDKKAFPQIAYGVRPIIYACVEAYKQTGDTKYRAYATQWISWFSGNNIASKVMYDAKIGRGYDGIRSAVEINKNSGAESTIEALLSIQAYNLIN